MLPTQQEVNQFIDRNFSNKLEKLNSQRKKSLASSFSGCVTIVLVMGVVMGVNFLTLGSPHHTQILIGSFAVVFVITMAYSIYARRNTVEDYEYLFKNEVIEPLIKFINKDFVYKPESHISHQEFLKSGFFVNDAYQYDGNDQLIGKYNDVLFQFCDLYVTKTPAIKTKNQSDYTVFYGNFFMAKFNKPFQSETYIIPNYSLKENVLGDDFDTGSFLADTWNFGDKVLLEDVEFNKMAKVYAHDQVEARYILTTSMMERIKKVQQKTKGKLFISFRNDLVFIANNNGFDYFEPNFYKSINSKEAILGYYNEIVDLLGIIDELKLNVKIWRTN